MPQWYVKPTADRGRAEGWMCLASDPPTRPELSRGTCEVWDGDRWTVQTSVTVLTAACAFESMLDVQIFCAEESKALQEKLNATLKRAIGMLSTGINPDRVEEGTKQLDSLLEDLEEQLRLLNQQQMEQEEEASATAKVLENDFDKDRKQITDVAVEVGLVNSANLNISPEGGYKINVMKSKSDNVVNQNGSTHTRISEIIGMGSDVMTHF